MTQTHSSVKITRDIYSFLRAPKTIGLNNNTIRFDLSRDDLICLNEGEFLNDNIIDFYLQ